MKQKLWCCVGYEFKEPCYYFPSLAHRKIDSISKFSVEPSVWENYKKHGWECIKVEVTIKPI